jgi:hypothetical protein
MPFHKDGLFQGFQIDLFCSFWFCMSVPAPNIQVLIDKINSLDLKQGAILILAVVTLSIIIQPLQRPMVRIMEGYWGSNKIALLFTNIINETAKE